MVIEEGRRGWEAALDLAESMAVRRLPASAWFSGIETV